MAGKFQSTKSVDLEFPLELELAIAKWVIRSVVRKDYRSFPRVLH